jgi:hypothetical protein
MPTASTRVQARSPHDALAMNKRSPRLLRTAAADKRGTANDRHRNNQLIPDLRA